MNIKEIVNDEEWQALRKSFLGTWKKQPAVNVLVLRSYLCQDEDFVLRKRRVHNYLTGTAFRLRKIAHPAIDEFVTELRKAA